MSAVDGSLRLPAATTFVGFVRQFRGAVLATRLSAAARWRTVRGAVPRAWMWAGLLVASGALAGAGRTGDTVRMVAELEADTAAGIFARAYLVDWVSTGFGSLAAMVGAFVLVVTLIAPLSTPISPGLIPAGDAAGFPRPRMARYTDSLLGHLISLTTVLQILAVTALASMVTLDGQHRVRAVLIAWAAWVCTVPIAQGIGWATEYARRTHHRALRWTGALAGVVTVAVIGVDPQHGSTLFGAGPHLTNALRSSNLAAVAATLLVMFAAATLGGWVACAKALARPEVRARTAMVRRRVMPTGLRFALVAQVVRTAVRTRVIRTPVILVICAGMIGAVVGGDAPQVVAAITVTVPLMLTLTWAVNSLAVLTGAAPWLSSLPGASGALLRVHAGVAFTLCAGGTLVCWVPAVLTGQVAPGIGVRIVGITVAVAAVLTASAMTKSVTRPHPAALEDGEGLLAPAVTIAYTLRLLLTGGLAGAVILLAPVAFTGTDLSTPVFFTVCAALGCAGYAWWAWTAHRWANPTVRAQALAGAHR